jgi:hypothetical protein
LNPQRQFTGYAILALFAVFALVGRMRLYLGTN